MTFHAPNLHRRVRDAAAGDVDAALEADGPLAVLRERGIDPRAISVQATRNLMQKHCETAGIDVDGEYLKPHGGDGDLGTNATANRPNSPRRCSATRTSAPRTRVTARFGLPNGNGRLRTSSSTATRTDAPKEGARLRRARQQRWGERNCRACLYAHYLNRRRTRNCRVPSMTECSPAGRTSFRRPNRRC